MIRSFEAFVEPPPPPRAACACGVFAPVVLVPVGAGAVPACALCAHDYVAHDRAIGSGSGCTCECSREEIYGA